MVAFGLFAAPLYRSMTMDAALQQQLAALAAKLGTTTERLWTVILVQQPINAVFDFLSFVGVLVLTIIWARFVWEKATTRPGMNYPDWTDEGGRVFAWISVAILAFLLLYGFAASAPKWVAAFTNPEYAALRDLFHMMRK